MTTLSQARAALTSGQLDATSLVGELLTHIEEKNPSIGALISYDREQALADAHAADLDKPLGGVPVLLKDNINALGQPCTCGSRFLEKGYTAPYDATVTRKLREAGAILLGRANMDEFAMGSACENSALVKTVNPHDPSRIAGGSSGGSAAAVAAGMALASLGSDTGGSIRQPAAHCGLVGLKPSYGRVSRYGLVAFASSLDQIGPLTHTVEDAALLLQVIAGHDPLDSTSLQEPVPDYSAALDKGVQGLRIGLPKQYFAEGLDPAIESLVRQAAARLEAQGAELVEIDLPATDAAVATYYILAPAEASSNLSRFDGIRYGVRSQNASDIIDTYRKSREEGFGPEVKRRILLGTYVLSSGYYDAYYKRAQRVRNLIQREFTAAFQEVDAILTPTSPTPPRKLGVADEDPLQDYLADIYTISANLAGLPGISVPCGTVDSGEGSQLPVGVQVMAPHLRDDLVLQIGRALETE
ncbi:Asp-tRNA(Asn)/Glu-tRNA(Gln) amidotransferase subunit GatA [Roseibacillus ishigakijimensis]|uniref:Glutamyl-tRNA(Gln) amidotransferase subunit A n=1 Tax=Roseibacillus ishigakijimensis TaxID=454146 RepID=A0A934VMG0_9BACT|nr:Asp-tRNA(Asn)/Glu-tRNA(Gln) amidotransferase subunit GatA [Roseibacillus ishigakijimensis]MBK1834242.1 Asp-tRNA(Asn)/Glu-tRNA(Gln) amidotransferase subunit GatA [Roseibacillus ishigakijimensis]